MNDSRFTDKRFREWLENKVGEPFPTILESIETLETKEDALQTAQAIDTFFAGDGELKSFANWCRNSAEWAAWFHVKDM